MVNQTINQLNASQLATENARLRALLAKNGIVDPINSSEERLNIQPEEFTPYSPLSKLDVQLYSRHLLMPELGVERQLKLKSSSVLVVGAGGLGAPSLLYLAAAGIGKIGIIDYDVVEVSNLHRQIIHNLGTVGISKVESAAQAINGIAPNCNVSTFNLLLDASNSMEIIKQFDIVLDCTDNVATRYLLNDCCVLNGKPLVSGSALRMEGQLTTYNYGDDCPCYRCLFPKPPPKNTVTNCSDGGVLGVVPGIIGCMQALETIKILCGIGASYTGKMLLFSAMRANYRTVKLRNRAKATCEICGDNATIKSPIDYVQFCGSSANDKPRSLSVIPKDLRWNVKEYYEKIKRFDESCSSHILLDVRPEIQYQITHIPGSINIPRLKLVYKDGDNESYKLLMSKYESLCEIDPNTKIIVICRRGNESQLATEFLWDKGIKSVIDVIGGLLDYSKIIDNDIPIY